MSQPANPGSRFSLAIESAIILFACATGIGLARAWKSGQNTTVDYAVVIAVPAMASLMFTVVAILVRPLLAVGRIKFPLNITLPLIYMSFVILAAALIARVGPSASLSLSSMRPELRNLHLWVEDQTLAFCVVGQVLVLTALSAFSDRTKSSASP